MDEVRVRKFILSKLFRHHIIGGKHTSVDNLPKGLPPDLKGLAKEVIKELIKEDLLFSKPTHDGLHVSLNPRRVKDIEVIVNS